MNAPYHKLKEGDEFAGMIWSDQRGWMSPKGYADFTTATFRENFGADMVEAFNRVKDTKNCLTYVDLKNHDEPIGPTYTIGDRWPQLWKLVDACRWVANLSIKLNQQPAA